jgi:hypothetical protein
MHIDFRAPRRPLALLVPLLAAALISAAPAAAGTTTPTEGAWGGRTSAGLPVSFEVKAGHVVNVKFTFLWGFCGIAESALLNEETIRPDGSWTYLDGRGPKIEGTFTTPDQVEGLLTIPSRELPSCEGSKATFTAAPGPVPPAPPILINDGRGHLAKEPTRITIPRNRVQYLKNLRWQKIGVAEARATGTAVIAAPGRPLHRPALIILTHPVARGESRTYTRLTYDLRGALPAGVPRRAEIIDI